MPLLTGSQEMSPMGRHIFGGALAAAMALLAYLISGLSSLASWLLLGLGIVCLVIYYGMPGRQPQLIALWRWLTWPLAWLVGHALLSSVYFGVLLPIGLWRRSVDALQLRHEELESGWKDKRKFRSDQEYFRQF